MAVERLIKRTIWVSKCPKCGDQKEETESAPRERKCIPCDLWVPFVEQSFTGPDLTSPFTRK